MFADLLKRLSRPDPEPLAESDARLALAALLVRVARTDGTYSEDEAERIAKLLVKRYGLSQADALALRQDAEILESEAPDTVRFTREIKDHVEFDDRVAVIEALWDVVLTDGVRDTQENTLLRLVAKLLGINDRDSNLARKRVEARQA